MAIKKQDLISGESSAQQPTVRCTFSELTLNQLQSRWEKLNVIGLGWWPGKAKNNIICRIFYLSFDGFRTRAPWVTL